MKNITQYIILFAVLITAFNSIAAETNIKGKVFGYDANRKSSPIKNARIVVIPSMRGAMSSATGNFSFDTHIADSLLVISSAGYKADTLILSNISDRLNIVIQLENIELEGVNVTGTKVATTLDFSGGIRTETITTRGLQKAACCNLSESFTTTPAVDIQYSDAITGAKRIQLLGLQSIYTQFQQENIPFMRGLASNYGFAFVPGQWLNSISISKGASTVKNGFESITGLIDVAYKQPEDEYPTTLNFYINDMLMMEVNADHTINFNETTGTTFFLHSNLFKKEVDHNSDGFLDRPMGNQINFLQRFHTRAGIWENKSAYQIMYDDRQGGQLGYHTGAKRVYDSSESPILWGMRNKTKRYNFNTRNGFIFNDAGTNIGSILSFTHHKQEAYFGNRTFNGEQNSFYANIMFQLPINAATDCDDEHNHSNINHNHSTFENTTITAGFSIQYDNYKELFDSFYYNNNIIRNNDANVVIPGLFIEYAFRVFGDLNTVIGIRGDIPKISINEVLFPNQSTTLGDNLLLSPRLHLKYGLIPDSLILAGSVGRGYRVARELAENSSYLASNRRYILNKNNNIEEAWNYGANMFWTTKLFDCPIDFNIDFYRTDFIDQLVVDLDKSPDEVHLYSLIKNNGKSYSNAFQVDATLELITNLFITLAYRMNDVKQTTAAELRDKPLQSKHKSFLNIQYNTDMNDWAFDLTFDYNGSGRLPLDVDYTIKRYEPFLLINAQITKAFKYFDIYIGAENLTNYKIKDAIKGNLTPFAPGFDASMIYGPITGVCTYLGIRYKIY